MPDLDIEKASTIADLDLIIKTAEERKKKLTENPRKLPDILKQGDQLGRPSEPTIFLVLNGPTYSNTLEVWVVQSHTMYRYLNAQTEAEIRKMIKAWDHDIVYRGNSGLISVLPF